VLRKLFHIPNSRTPAIVNAGWPVLLIAIAAVALALYQLRAEALNDARRNIANLALVLGEQTARSVQAIDLVVRELQESVIELNADSARSFENLAGGKVFREILQEKRALISQADMIGVIDATGRLINASRDEGRIGLDLSDRDYFRHLRAFS
jgi:hypothetical protein